MPEPENLQATLSKVHTHPKKGCKLGTVSATWKKIKSTTNESPEKSSPEKSESNLVAFGENSMLVLFPSGILEVWTWESHADTMRLAHQARTGLTRETVCHLAVLDSSPSRCVVLVMCQNVIETYEVAETAVRMQTVQLPMFMRDTQAEKEEKADTEDGKTETYGKTESMNGKMNEKTNGSTSTFSVVISRSFVAIGRRGSPYVYILRIQEGWLVFPNEHHQLHGLRKDMSPFSPKELSSSEVVIRTSCSDGMPIFDLVEGWLVYSPTKEEARQMENEARYEVEQPSVDPLFPGTESVSERSAYTCTRLPPSGPLLNKVMSSVSNIAADGLFRFSKMGSEQVHKYLHNETPSMNVLGKRVGRMLYSTAQSTAHSLQTGVGSNQIVRVVDLAHDTDLGAFKAPGGVSAVSLSPYDSQLVHATSRGDAFYMWDLLRLPVEVSLVGKFRRGKTSGVVRDICWFVEKGTNAGFGCITKASGSVHWFNVNYLVGRDNYPRGRAGDFLDSWILPSFGAEALVGCGGSLGVVKGGHLSVVSTWNGRSQYRYDFPKEPAVGGIERESVGGVGKDEEGALCHAEIETCAPFAQLWRDIEFVRSDSSPERSEGEEKVKFELSSPKDSSPEGSSPERSEGEEK